MQLLSRAVVYWDVFLHVRLLSFYCRRFLLPEYLPYAGIFHERGQPGLATHSSVNRVLAGNENSLFAGVMYVSGIFLMNLSRGGLMRKSLNSNF